MEIYKERKDIQKIQGEVLPRLVDDWALLTAGDKDDWNTMTIAWGSMGDIWWDPVVDVYVVPTRYTYEFMERHDIFTVSFFPEKYRSDMELLGSESGRDGDKVAKTSLTPVEVEKGGMSFEEADTIFVCKKIYTQPLDPEAIPKPVMNTIYEDMQTHTLYIGRIIAAIKK